VGAGVAVIEAAEVVEFVAVVEVVEVIEPSRGRWRLVLFDTSPENAP